MRTADTDNPWRAGAGMRTRSDWRGSAINRGVLGHQQAFGADTDDSSPDGAERGCDDNAEHRFAARDEGNVDGELVGSGDEFARPVQRIDQEKAVAVGPRGQMGAFFRQHRNIGSKFRESFGDDGISKIIGIAHHRAVDFLAEPHGVAVDRKDRHACLDGELRERLHQREGVFAGEGNPFSHNLFPGLSWFVAGLCGRGRLRGVSNHGPA